MKHFIEVESGSECKLLSDRYVGNMSKMKFQCKCGNKFNRTYRHFRNRKQYLCNECSKKLSAKNRTKWTESEVMKYLQKFDYSLLSNNFKNAREQLLLVCSNSHVYTSNFNNFYSGKRCPECASEKMRKERQLSMNEIQERIGGDYRIIGEYINCLTPVRAIHLTCGTIFDLVVNNVNRNNSNCPKCRVKSLGELKIKEILRKYEIDYDCQHRFDDCRHIYPLPFDFSIFKRGNLKLLVEYDGEQHYRGWSGLDDNLEIGRAHV